jgi:hypothetical protein
MTNKLNSRPAEVTKRFLSRCLFTVLAIICLIAGFNYVVNPYRVFSSNSDSTANDQKIRPQHMQYEIRSILARRSKADLLFIGNSRMEIGVNPAALQLQPLGSRSFNLAVAGATAQQATQALPLIISEHKPKHVVIGADFYEFVAQGTGKTDQMFKSDWAGKSWYPAKVQAKSLFTLEASLDSVMTLSLPYRKYPQTLTALGHNPMLDFQGHAKTSGYRVLFDTGNVRLKEVFSEGRALMPQLLRHGARSMDELKQLVDYLAANRIDVTIVTFPVHLEFVQIAQRNGLWIGYENWKRQLAEIGASASSRHTLKVWDFACEGKAISERIPEAGDRTTEVRSYWDSGHFKSHIGKQMVEAALTAQGTIASTEDLTGYLLNPSTITQVLPKCLNAFESYEAASR